MEKSQFVIEAVPDDIRAIIKPESSDILISNPRRVRSAADVLHSPIGPEELRQTLEMITVVLKTGTALMQFIAVLLPVINALGKRIIIVRDPKTGERRGTLTSQSTQEEIRKMLEG